MFPPFVRSMKHEDLSWHSEALSLDAQKTLTELSALPVLEPFYLAGGTALALQRGHRISLDLDFFSTSHVDEDVLIAVLKDESGIQVISKSPETLHLHIGATKVSFIGFHYPVLFPFVAYGASKIADVRDIAAMKLSAIASRGTKRDFIDLYILAEEHGLKELMRLFDQKFASAQYNPVHILKSLTYFADADKEPMPHMLRPLTWDTVKQFLTREAPRLRRP